MSTGKEIKYVTVNNYGKFEEQHIFCGRPLLSSTIVPSAGLSGRMEGSEGGSVQAFLPRILG